MNLDLQVGTHRIRMTYSATLGANHVTSLVSVCGALAASVGLDRVMFNQTAPGVFSYRIWLLGGRQWRQVLTFTGTPDPNPDMTFDVQPGWKLDEFSAQRDFRLECISLRNSVGCTLLRLDPP